MKFIINILPNQLLDEPNLSSFVNNITSQYHSSELQIIIKQTSQLQTGLFEYIDRHELPITVIDSLTDVTLADSGDTYWLNLHVDDALLPNAIMQWENTLTNHATDLLMLNYVNNDQRISDQLDPIFENLGEVKETTIRHIFEVDPRESLFDLPLSKKLDLLLGLQSYYLNDRNYRYRTFFNNVDLTGRNVLYRVNSERLHSDKNYLAKLLYDLIDNDDFVRLNMPTMVLSANSTAEQVKQGLLLIQNGAFIFDEKIKNYYLSALANRLATIYESVHADDHSEPDRNHWLKLLNDAVSDLPAENQVQLKARKAKRGVLNSVKQIF
ncbi:hypothetical protein [Lactobacillus sp. Sy-1]|uniref:hypothetical protein n=1 Tax=Lactobacillus sp. Sy-1 TaxID=2109645 RepID=UPI001C55B3B7|nr:hypothetical protein [Lactobacillus sp. Sy-1]MBW1605501.1 hypothetical protein [Lactobacillus sp. Sy-1]